MEEREKLQARIGRVKETLQKKLEGWVDYKAQPEDLHDLPKWEVKQAIRAIIDGDGLIPDNGQEVFDHLLAKSPEAQELWDKLQQAQAELKALKPEPKPKRVDLPSSSFSTTRWGEVYPDRVEIWHRNFTGARRSPQTTLDRVLTRDEFRALYKEEWAQERARLAQKRAEEEAERAREEAWKAWVETLPTDLGDGWVRVGSEIFDEHQNFCFSVPSKPVPDFQAWFNKTLADFLESGE